ncbi:DUF2786 domain-containing protein (plasmid) [Shewanella sp. KX20019]|uniref:DUF2786 domain-containing protein n=1 Tax=Shewanella sp. KX20019 TaxID=2803864 RepID=UPI00192832C6|nr:DUF2786 domain-containing protein [Shewanella sp. KX20019]QQX82684.1 DUF2786 domain-containing protein [Shewanella sp. KX20019]
MNDKALDKVKKCLELAKSTNEHEAAQAIAMAQKLMKKYGLSDREIEFMNMGDAVSKSRVQVRPPVHIVALVNVIATSFGVKPLLLSDHGHCKVQFIGEEAESLIASYSFDLCIRELTRLRSDYVKTIHKNCKAYTKTVRADAYCRGWVSEVKNKLPVPEQEEEKRVMLKNFYDDFVSGQRITTTNAEAREKKGSDDFKHFMKGSSDGKKFNVRTPVSGKSNIKLIG